ncbi:ATP-dependent protease subunit HslV [Candidatus Poribacteria bacterium]|nr:ATP-dependent protease subunit HslV [Candidatus Poribacteria bacterium]
MTNNRTKAGWRSTTICAVRKDGQTAIGGDGQISLQNIALKHGARKVRRIYKNEVLCGFAGATADAIELLERFEAKMEEHGGNLTRAAVELTKLWRTDRLLRRLEAMMLVADRGHILLLSGTGDVVEPDEPVIGIGSGGAYAQAAALALYRHSALTAEEIVRESLRIAGGLCVFTNLNATVETL